MSRIGRVFALIVGVETANAFNVKRSVLHLRVAGMLVKMVGRGPHNGGGGENSGPMFEGRAAIGYDHGYDGEVFYLGLALDEKYVEGWVEGCLERIGEDDPEGEDLLRGEWEEGDRDLVMEVLQAGCEVRTGRPPGY